MVLNYCDPIWNFPEVPLLPSVYSGVFTQRFHQMSIKCPSNHSLSWVIGCLRVVYITCTRLNIFRRACLNTRLEVEYVYYFHHIETIVFNSVFFIDYQDMVIQCNESLATIKIKYIIIFHSVLYSSLIKVLLLSKCDCRRLYNYLSYLSKLALLDKLYA